ncbi:plasmid pRiA4b ORF-3 family protein [Treponema sp. OttesenSCG-928-L16]|nr:plasmid pRiA4b ORF-3 family protein [Treponema sp. OttesenSCG-928-L16]
MTINQEDALYEFLENTVEPFKTEEAFSFVRMADSRGSWKLIPEIDAFLDTRRLAFRHDKNRWLSKRGCFEASSFVIKPTRLELLNGILIPGHRCVPFANPVLLPHEYTFFWEYQAISMTNTEADPEELYPYYSIFGEEYAPQYVARDNPENESAFNEDPYEDPAEVSIHTLDMRTVYRETSFVPGDFFAVRLINWKNGSFRLEKVNAGTWSQENLDEWQQLAEQSFAASFKALGPARSTEEQVAYAYWFGGERMRNVPCYALEDFLYEKSEAIETVSYGIETRFWFAGREIPDRRTLEQSHTLPDQTSLEEMLHRSGIPISEYVVQSYVRDSFFRNEADIARIIDRIAPPSVQLGGKARNNLAQYVAEAQEEYRNTYSRFTDNQMGPIRQRVGELHSAVIDLVARLHKGEIDEAWLPKHTFVILSQIQEHAAGILEDLDVDEQAPEMELETLDNSLDSMIETYEDIRDLIEESLDSFRKVNISVVRKGAPLTGAKLCRVMQASLSGTNVWRRFIVGGSASLDILHGVLQILFQWKNRFPYKFTAQDIGGTGLPESILLDSRRKLEDLVKAGISELDYEYGKDWVLKLMFLSAAESHGPEQVLCSAGSGAPPPEDLGGPKDFGRLIAALESGRGPDWEAAVKTLGTAFDPARFDAAEYNRSLASVSISKT